MRDDESLLRAFSEAEKANKEVRRPSNYETQCRTLGLCPWSMPIDNQETDAFSIISMCQTMNGIMLPYPNLPLDEQPNLFFLYLRIYNQAKSDYTEAKFDHPGETNG